MPTARGSPHPHVMTHITYPAQMDCGNGTPMRRALELAWDAYCAGSFPVGAVLTDPDGVIVAEGRNHAGESTAPDGLMRGTVIAHAEMSVLARRLRRLHTLDHARALPAVPGGGNDVACRARPLSGP